MEIEIGLFAGLSCNNPDLPSNGENTFLLNIPDGLSICQLRNLLAIDPAIPLVVMVNNRHAEESSILRAGDRVAMFPPLGGG